MLGHIDKTQVMKINISAWVITNKKYPSFRGTNLQFKEGNLPMIQTLTVPR